MSRNHLAEKKLAGLIALELDVIVKDEALGAFIRDNWGKVAPLAHLIHNAKDETEPAGPSMVLGGPPEPEYASTPLPKYNAQLEKVKVLVRRYGDEMRQATSERHLNRKPSADPSKIGCELMAALDELVKQ